MPKLRLLAVLACLTLSASCVGPDIDFSGLDCIFEYQIRPASANAAATVAAGDSIALVASRVPECSGRWPVTWTVTPTSVATIRATGDSTAMLRGTVAGYAAVEVHNGESGGVMQVQVTQ
jgi:hypothetical protein